MFGRPVAGSEPAPPSQPQPVYRPAGATGAFQSPQVQPGPAGPTPPAAEQGPSEYTRMISMPANIGGAPPPAPQQPQGQSMMQPMMPVMQPPMMSPPVLQPPVVQPPMMQPPMVQAPMVQAPMVQGPMVQPPMMQAPMVQPPMMQAPMMQTPAPQPAKGKFPWLLVSIVFLLGVLVAGVILLLVLKK